MLFATIKHAFFFKIFNTVNSYPHSNALFLCFIFQGVLHCSQSKHQTLASEKTFHSEVWLLTLYRHYIAGYSVANFLHFPVRCHMITFICALEFRMIISQDNDNWLSF